MRSSGSCDRDDVAVAADAASAAIMMEQPRNMSVSPARVDVLRYNAEGTVVSHVMWLAHASTTGLVAIMSMHCAVSMRDVSLLV